MWDIIQVQPPLINTFKLFNAYRPYSLFETTYMVHSPPYVLDPNATVSRLIDVDTNRWNYALLEQIFSRDEINSIQFVPLSITNQENALIWRGTTNGLFSMRSAYHMQKEREVASKAEGSSRVRDSSMWSFIWQQKIPNAKKHFLCCVCHEILPTKVKLIFLESDHRPQLPGMRKRE